MTLTLDVWDEACRLTVTADGFWPLLTYRFSPTEPKPYVATLLAPSAPLPGLAKSIVQDAPADHPHHRGVWYGHGHFGDADVWLEQPDTGRVTHDGFTARWDDTTPADGRTGAGFVSTDTWTAADGRVLGHDTRGVCVLPRDDSPGFSVDLDFRLVPADGAVTLGECVDAGFPAVRLADVIDQFDGGHFVTDTGVAEFDTAGTEARWLAAWGRFDGSPMAVHDTCGIAMLDHPTNPGHPAKWFTRPFGWFTPSGTQFAPIELPADGLRWRHRLVVFAGEPDTTRLDAAWDDFAAADGLVDAS